MERTNQKVALVTGGNRGLGLATAKRLGAAGYHVVLTARELASGEAAAESIRVAGGSAQAMRLDLSSPPSVRAFAKAYRETGLPIHLLHLNAGLMAYGTAVETNEEGLELQFATNHLGHFLLERELENVVLRSAPARIMVVSSSMHIPGTGPGKGPDFDYDNLRGEKSYDAMLFYRNSKLANMWFAYALSRRLKGKGVTVNALCPGFVPETAAAGTKGFQRLLFKYVFPLLPNARTADQASMHLARIATDPAFDGVTGKFFADGKEGKSSDESYDVAKQDRLWDFSERAIGASSEKARSAQPH
jgi:NAD(P)-dependent dehydrogenase (short-subunit alcohol dehydrogenase family)